MRIIPVAGALVAAALVPASASAASLALTGDAQVGIFSPTQTYLPPPITAAYASDPGDVLAADRAGTSLPCPASAYPGTEVRTALSPPSGAAPIAFTIYSSGVGPQRVCAWIVGSDGTTKARATFDYTVAVVEPAATLALTPLAPQPRSGGPTVAYSGSTNASGELRLTSHPGAVACAADPDAGGGTSAGRVGIFAAGTLQGQRAIRARTSGTHTVCAWVVTSATGAPRVLTTATALVQIVDRPSTVKVTVTPRRALRQGTRVEVTGDIRSDAPFAMPSGGCRVEQRVGRRWRVERARFLLPGRDCTASVVIANPGPLQVRVRYLGVFGSYRGDPDVDSNWAPSIGYAPRLRVAPGGPADLARVRADAKRVRVTTT